MRCGRRETPGSRLERRTARPCVIRYGRIAEFRDCGHPAQPADVHDDSKQGDDNSHIGCVTACETEWTVIARNRGRRRCRLIGAPAIVLAQRETYRLVSLVIGKRDNRSQRAQHHLQRE